MAQVHGIDVGRSKVVGELKRELKMRKSFYARQIQNRKMTKGQANAQYLRLERAKRVIDNMSDAEFERVYGRASPPPTRQQELF